MITSNENRTEEEQEAKGDRRTAEEPKEPLLQILVVDDDEVDRMAARRAARHSGLNLELTEARTGADALTALRSGKFDCALLDYQLPDANGLEILKKVHEAGITTPILMLTGHGDELIAVELMKAGAVDYLPKSRLSADSLASCLRTALRIRDAELQTQQAEKALRESEERFRLMADSAPVLLWVSGVDSQYTFFNKVWLDFTGKPMEQETGEGWSEGVHPDDLARCMETYRTAFQAHRRFQMEFRLRRYDGGYRWMLDTGAPRFLPDGSFAGFIGSCVDITERKQFEEALLRNQAHIAALNERLRQMMSATHDRVRNTLQIIAAIVDIRAMSCEASLPIAELKQLANQVHILASVHDILTHHVHQTDAAQAVSARAILEKILPLFESMAGGQRFESYIEEAPLRAEQATALPIIANELLSNAFKYGKKDGRVGLRLTAEGSGAMLEVWDEGPGFPAGFDPIRAGHIGLELVERLSHWDLHGETRYENRPEGGGRVRITMPTAENFH